MSARGPYTGNPYAPQWACRHPHCQEWQNCFDLAGDFLERAVREHDVDRGMSAFRAMLAFAKTHSAIQNTHRCQDYVSSGVLMEKR